MSPVTAPKVLVIAGPTAVGKSALALSLCEKLSGELVSVDSVQVYRGLQIGSAKPSEDERRRVRHHLLDLRDPNEEYTAGAFYSDALHAVQDVLSRGRTPVLVGGTMMYMRWLAHGRPGAPKSDPEIAERVRQRLAPFEAAGDWEAGLAILGELDAARAAQLGRNDWYRLHRAVVVAMQGGSSPAAEAPSDELLALDALRSSLDMRCVFVHGPRMPLCERIDSRCCQMLEGGLLEEVADELVGRRLLPSCPAGRAIGYRQTLDYLMREPYVPGDEVALREYVEGFTSASRRYASQQVKWFRSEPQFEWLAADWTRPPLQTPTQEASAGAGTGSTPVSCFDAVLRSFECGREEYDALRAHERQAALRQVNPADGKAMRTYTPRVPLLDDTTSRAAILRRADACCERLQPVIEEIRAADVAAAERYPWHTRAKRGPSVAPTSDGDDDGGAKAARAEGGGDAEGGAGAAPAP